VREAGATLNQFGRIRHFHFIGLGGVGMSALAELLLAQGTHVSGSDGSDSEYLRRLAGLGARCFVGHEKSQLDGAEVVVVSSAIPPENVELQEARERDLPIIHRSELLAEMMRFRESIAVAGSHGKTTTSAMIAHLLLKAGLDPTVAVGARVRSLGGNARLGNAPFFVAEADESDRSFLRLHPVHAVVTNLDLDHTEQYRDLKDVSGAFRTFLEQLPFYGYAVVCGDDYALQSVVRNVHHRVVTYGASEQAEFRATAIDSGPFTVRFELSRRGTLLGTIQLQVGGRHNALNATAAASIGHRLGIPFDEIRDALGGFVGAERRMERKGERDGVLVLDDYAHHPTEVRATLEACRAVGRRIVLVFQPHRFSRTLGLMNEFATCFEEADRLYLLDIYPAGEAPIEGVNSSELARRIGRLRQADYIPSEAALLRRLRSDCRPGDLLVTMGAGDVWKLGEKFLEGSE
jgi:UDP-N-acetylmuramate--alanine ligase